ncbi:PH domain-containing protein [Eggerthellaceae bacterium zg-1084]|uniref:PH domain-containing protein n=1 Tax=Berryella wangjianweii TaxID=2734634 RepID=UPI001556E33C|nr:PH domain-containing protein [Berryella wangjianweii]NPD30302.1 PH domain-containing protein [Berryella wangjianweii]
MTENGIPAPGPKGASGEPASDARAASSVAQAARPEPTGRAARTVPAADSSAADAPDAASSEAGTSSSLRFRTGEAHHVHHSFVWLQLIVSMGLIVVLSAVNIAQNVGRDIDDLFDLFAALGEGVAGVLGGAIAVVLAAAVGVIVLTVLLAGIMVLTYRNLTYCFDEGELTIRSGIIIKKAVHIPYTKVQSVDYTASIPQRIFGVCSVRIETAGGSANKANKLPYVLLSSADSIRYELFARKALALNPAARIDVAPAAVATGPARPAAPQAPWERTASPNRNAVDSVADEVMGHRGVWGGAAPTVEQAVSFERRLTNRELIFAAITDTSPARLVAFWVVAVTGLTGFMQILGVRDEGVYVAAVLALPILLAYPANVMRAVFRYAGFTVRRRGTRIEVEHGLLKRMHSSIEADRVQSVDRSQNILRRLMGHSSVALGRIDSVESSGSSSAKDIGEIGRLVVHPFLHLDQVESFIDGLLPEFAAEPATSRRLMTAPCALRRALWRMCLWRNPSLPFGAAAVALLALDAPTRFVAWAEVVEAEVSSVALVATSLLALVVAVAALQLAASVANAVIWSRGSWVELGRRFVTVRNDGIATAQVRVPRHKVQTVRTRTNPFQRLARVASVSVQTAAGINRTSHTVWDLAAADAQDALDWLMPHRNQ